MNSTVNATYLGIKVTEFEANRYLKVFLAVQPDPEDKNVSGLDVMICAADIEHLYEYESLQPHKQYQFKTKIQSGAKNRISIKIIGIKESQPAKHPKNATASV